MSLPLQEIACQESELPGVFFRSVALCPQMPVLPHWHDRLEILHFTSGRAEVYLGEQCFAVDAGQMVVVESHSIHSVAARTADCAYDCLMITDRYCRAYGIESAQWMIESPLDGGVFRKWFDELREFPPVKDGQERFLFGAGDIVELLFRQFATKRDMPVKKSKPLDVVRRTILYVQNNFREKGSIEDICREIGYSKYYICHAFKEATGITLIDYINLQRCRYASALLMEDKLSVGEIARCSGFNSNSYFAKIYKKYMGVPPSKM